MPLPVTITCSKLQSYKVLSCIFMIKKKKKKKIETQFLLLQRNPKCWEEKSYHYQIYYCLKLKPFFHEKLFQKEKNKLLLSTCDQQFSGHLFVNGQQKSPVAGLI